MEYEDNSDSEQHHSRESYPSYGRRRPRLSPKIAVATKEVLFKQAHIIVKQADKHEQFLNKVKYCFGVLGFGAVCYLMGSKPQEIPSLYCLFFMLVVPMRWIYYRSKKWHYYLLDFCYYANIIFMVMLLRFPKNEKLFMLCFSFSEGPLAWALIVWRCSLVFNHFDKIISVLIHLLPGTVIFILRWWDPVSFPQHSGPWPDAPSVLWTWLFFVPLLVYCIWQALYFLIVEGLRRQRLMNDPEVMTSYRELKRKAERANNIWWHLSGLLGEKKRVIMYAIIQAAFTVATLALTVPLFRLYRLHAAFEIFKLLATVWNGGNFLLEVMPRQVIAQKKKKEDDDSKCGNATGGGGTLGSTMILINKNGASIPADLAQLAGFVLNDQVVCSLCKTSTMEVQLKHD